jgi:hypothetical protein
MWPCTVTNFLIIKPTRCTNFSNLFWKWNYIQTAFEQQDQDGTAGPSGSCWKAVYKPVWHTPSLSVQWITSDDGQRNCPKHVEFHFQNKFEKLVHLVGFIIRKFVTVHGHTNVKFVPKFVYPVGHITGNVWCGWQRSAFNHISYYPQ